MRINSKLRCAPPPRTQRPGPGRPKKHGSILHPGWDNPEIPPSEEIWAGYRHRSARETNFYVAQDSAGMEMPRAWTEKAIKRRIGLAMLVGFVLKAIAAVCQPLPIGPWDRKPEATAGRLANYLEIHLSNFVPLALRGVEPRKYRKIPKPEMVDDLQLLDTA